MKQQLHAVVELDEGVLEGVYLHGQDRVIVDVEQMEHVVVDESVVGVKLLHEVLLPLVAAHYVLVWVTHDRCEVFDVERAVVLGILLLISASNGSGGNSDVLSLRFLGRRGALLLVGGVRRLVGALPGALGVRTLGAGEGSLVWVGHLDLNVVRLKLRR